jgi:broad specificity phosphatase PhoE
MASELPQTKEGLSKTVWLIRHAGASTIPTSSPHSSSHTTTTSLPLTPIPLVAASESENNVPKATFKETLGSWKMPQSTRGDWKAIGQLLMVRMNTPLSEHGREQVDAQEKVIAASEFVAKAGVQLILHSPLVRAKDTTTTIFGGGATCRL